MSDRQPRHRLGILISGRGSNLEALADACASGALPADIGVVVCNVADAPGIERARSRGLAVRVVVHRGLTREEHERRVAAELEAAGVTLACLAGWMRLFTPWLTRAWAGRMLNVHPSLLPAFPGVDAQAQALAHGVKVSGCTVHFVDAELDAGPIVMQAAVPVLDGDDVAALAARILEQEHRIYPEAVRLVVEGRVRIEGRRVVAGSLSE